MFIVAYRPGEAVCHGREGGNESESAHGGGSIWRSPSHLSGSGKQRADTTSNTPLPTAPRCAHSDLLLLSNPQVPKVLQPQQTGPPSGKQVSKRFELAIVSPLLPVLLTPGAVFSSWSYGHPENSYLLSGAV